MPQASYEYALGRISVLSTRMLNASQLRRINEAGSVKEAMALLVETGYGENLTEEHINSNEIDTVIREQLQLTRQRVWEITPEPELTGLFLLTVDTHNLKALLKARLLGLDASDILRSGGNFPLEELKVAVSSKNYERLPEIYGKTLDKIENDLTRSVDPLKFSALLDGAMFQQIKAVLDAKNEHGFIREYFALMADFLNARSVLRAGRMNWDVDKLKPLLLEGGDIPVKVFLDNLETPVDQLSGKFNSGRYGYLLASTLTEFVQTEDISVLKTKMEAELFAIIRRVKWDNASLGPIVSYLMGREAEAKALRVIFGSKQGGFEAPLPELYA